MKHRGVVITSLPQAFRVIKEMNPDTHESDYHSAGCQALEAILEGRMRERITYYLEEMARLGEVDRGNGSFSRHLFTSSGISSFPSPAPDAFLPSPSSVPVPAEHRGLTG